MLKIKSSPFPGTDPYLEDGIFWPDFHSDLITDMKKAITAKLPPGYSAYSQERIYVDTQEGERIPDVSVTRSNPTPKPNVSKGGAALLEQESDTKVSSHGFLTLYANEIRERYLEIRSNGEEMRW